MQLLPPSVDQIVGASLGRYHIEQLPGYGKLNAVYVVRDQQQDRTAMLTTFIIPDYFSPQMREQFMRRFTREASRLARLHHEHVLPVYDFGEQYGYPYLVTPLVTTGSLAKALKRQKCYTPEQVLAILKQVADGLDYAHSNGVVHGSLKPANNLLDDEQKVLIAGLGLVHILEMRGIAQLDQPFAHLFSIAGTFLGAPEYVALEVVQGAAIDARTDIYALGIIIYELLSGQPPFSGVDPLAVAMQHVQQPIPPLHAAYPDISPALDLALQRALAHNADQRYTSATRLTKAFERVLHVITVAQKGPAPSEQKAPAERDATLPPTIDWFEEELPGGKWQGMDAAPTALTAAERQITPPPAPAEAASVSSGGVKTVDPFVWWSTTSMSAVKPSEAGTFNPAKTPTKSLARRSPDKMRRRTVALLAGGGVVAVGVPGLGGLTLEHFLRQGHQPLTANEPTRTPTAPTPDPTPASTPTAQSQSTATATPTAQATPKKVQQAPTVAPTPTTPPPTPTPTPTPGHTGKVIGSTGQGTNTAKAFSNPADGRASLLSHLPGGNFVAYERACTHEGVAVNYNTGTHKLVCPRHGAIFDPANGAHVTKGPAKGPLASVGIRVNGEAPSLPDRNSGGGQRSYTIGLIHLETWRKDHQSIYAIFSCTNYIDTLPPGRSGCSNGFSLAALWQKPAYFCCEFRSPNA